MDIVASRPQDQDTVASLIEFLQDQDPARVVTIADVADIDDGATRLRRWSMVGTRTTTDGGLVLLIDTSS